VAVFKALKLYKLICLKTFEIFNTKIVVENKKNKLNCKLGISFKKYLQELLHKIDRLDYEITITQLKEVRGRWRYACSKSAVSKITHHTNTPPGVYPFISL